MFYPEDQRKTNWDLFITIILIFTCLSTPYLISFEGDSLGWQILNYAIDSCFLIDVFFSFNTAFYDDDFIIIEDRKRIGCAYLKSWFFIDITAIIPFDILVNQGGKTGSSYN